MIETERLILKPLTYAQLIKYIKCDNTLEEELNLRESSRTISDELKEAFEQTILPNVADETKNYLYSTLWTAISKSENKMVGDLCIIGEPNADGEIEIGYGTYEEFQNRGFMTEIVQGIIKWAKSEPNVKSIIASTDKSNIASYKVLEKNRFRMTGETEVLLNWKLDMESAFDEEVMEAQLNDLKMNRRTFVEKTALLGAAAFLPLSGLSNHRAQRYKMGLQLYTIHEDMTRDALSTLKAAKAMGYEDFETFGFDGEKGTFYGYQSSDFKKMLEDLEITASSGHYGFSSYLHKPEADLRRFVDQCIQGAHALDMKYITWPWIAPEQRTMDNYKLMAQKLNVIGEQVTGGGLGFAYHNHGFEFTDHNGENGFDTILKDTDPSLVKLQMDMYWVMRSSAYTPKELISQQPGRYVMWHIKDMDKVTGDYTELGNGAIDYAEILPDPAVSGLEFYYLEQGGNYAHSPMKSVGDSADYFKKHLQQYI
ncbi:GNAT family N-acetyltransferase [Marinoscillum sp.]|uniref:GNAT family N-acetyltransferase n=1 Tax=Marinoscillum sp. TaxID=2024838 RepID=UPI003BA9B301